MLKEMEELEGSAKAEELGFVDISRMFGGKVQAAAPGYRKMLELLEGIESKQKAAERERPQAARQEQAAHAEAGSKTAEVGAGTAANAQRVKEEMHTIIGGLSAPKPKFGELRIKRPNALESVLPNLQISDQIQELERIIAALKKNAFDREQMKIVRTELNDLKDYVGALKKRLRKEGKGLNELDQSLWDIRDSRLGEAISLSKSGA